METKKFVEMKLEQSKEKTIDQIKRLAKQLDATSKYITNLIDNNLSPEGIIAITLINEIEALESKKEELKKMVERVECYENIYNVIHFNETDKKGGK